MIVAKLFFFFFFECLLCTRVFLGGSAVKNPPASAGDVRDAVWSLDQEMATHSSILAWRSPWTGEPGGLQTMVSKSHTRLSDSACTMHQARCYVWRSKDEWGYVSKTHSGVSKFHTTKLIQPFESPFLRIYSIPGISLCAHSNSVFMWWEITWRRPWYDPREILWILCLYGLNFL